MVEISEYNSTPDELVPKLVGTPASEPAFYKSLYILETLEKKLEGSDETPSEGDVKAKPIEGKQRPLELPALGNKPASPLRAAIGVMTLHRQQWKQKGISLGNLLKSVSLAPGEVTQVAVVDWAHRTRGQSSTIDSQTDSVTSDIDQARAVNEIQTAQARETQSGGSTAASIASSTQAAVSGSSLMMSANLASAFTASGAMTAQFSTGGRDLAAQSSNAIDQRTAEKSSALRSRRSTVIRELTDSESETTSSRVLVNYNRRHTLNIEFFEVVQLYEIETRLEDWTRCLFVPMQPIDFAKEENRKRHRIVLSETLRAMRMGELSDLVSKDFEQAAKHAEERRKGLQAEIDKLKESESQLREEIKQCTEVADDISWYFNRLDGFTRDQHEKDKEKYEQLRLKFPEVFTGKGWGKEDKKILKEIRNRNRVNAERLRQEAGPKNAEWRELEEQLNQIKVPVDEFLDSNKLFFSQQVWLNTDPFTYWTMFQDWTLDGESLINMVDPHPVGVFGNMLAFRWGFRGDNAEKDIEDFQKQYISPVDAAEKRNGMRAGDGEALTIALPSGGVFAEAVLGRACAAELTDHSRDSRWPSAADGGAPPILPPKIAEIVHQNRKRDLNLDPTGLADALAALRSQPISDASHLSAILGQLGNGDMFRNMGGLAQAVSLADKLSALSAKGAADAGDRNVKLQSKMLDTFIEVLDSDVGKAAVAEFMLPGAGAALLQAGGSDDGKRKPKVSDGTKATDTPPKTEKHEGSDEGDVKNESL